MIAFSKSGDVTERAASDLLLRDLREESLDLVQPRTARRREMEIIFGMFLEPSLYHRSLMRSIIIQNDVNFDSRLSDDRSIDFFDEFEELLLSVSSITFAVNLSSCDVQCREKGSCAISYIVMCSSFGLSWRHRQKRLSSIQSLNLALFIDRENDSVLRRTQVQPDDVPNLLHKVRIRRDFEGFAFVGFQTEGVPDANDSTLGQSGRLGHSASAPMCRGFWFLLKSLCNDFLDLLVAD